jgi:hypothetical protein
MDPTARCPEIYEREGGREPGDRLVECHLQAGHPGEHEEAGTDVTWLNEAAVTCPHGYEPGDHHWFGCVGVDPGGVR